MEVTSAVAALILAEEKRKFCPSMCHCMSLCVLYPGHLSPKRGQKGFTFCSALLPHFLYCSVTMMCACMQKAYFHRKKGKRYIDIDSSVVCGFLCKWSVAFQQFAIIIYYEIHWWWWWWARCSDGGGCTSTMACLLCASFLFSIFFCSEMLNRLDGNEGVM